MKSLEAMRMSKLGSKKLLSADLMPESPVPQAEEVPASPVPSAEKMSGSMDILKAAKATGRGGVPTSDSMPSEEVPKTKSMPFSPIKSYLKTRK